MGLESRVALQRQGMLGSSCDENLENVSSLQRFEYQEAILRPRQQSPTALGGFGPSIQAAPEEGPY